MRGIEAPVNGRGGVAVLVREPAFLGAVESYTSKGGQVVKASIEGWGISVDVYAVYRRPGTDIVEGQLRAMLELHPGRQAIVGWTGMMTLRRRKRRGA